MVRVLLDVNDDEDGSIKFIDSDGGLVGKLYVNDGRLSFSGKATQSAELFIGEVLRLFDEYGEMQ